MIASLVESKVRSGCPGVNGLGSQWTDGSSRWDRVQFYLDDIDDDVSMTALRLLVKDLLVLFTAVNEGVINVLGELPFRGHGRHLTPGLTPLCRRTLL